MFERLGLTTAGPAGLYGVTFSCQVRTLWDNAPTINCSALTTLIPRGGLQGVWARPTDPFEVHSSVATVELVGGEQVQARDVNAAAVFG